MTLIRLTIPGDSVGKGRPRFNGQTGRTYTDTKTVTAERDVKAIWREAGCPRLSDDASIEASICVYVQRPASHFLKNGQLSTEGRRRPQPIRRPDLDNVAKLILDSLNGLAYRDDAQVTSLHVSRRWVPSRMDGPAVEVKLQTVSDVTEAAIDWLEAMLDA